VGRVVDPYLQRRPTLALCLALVDSKRSSPGQRPPVTGVPGGRGRRHAIVATKCDRLSGNDLRRSLKTLGEGVSGDDHRANFPAKTGAGKDEVWSLIRRAMGNVQPV